MGRYTSKEIELRQTIMLLRKERNQISGELREQAYAMGNYLKPSNILTRTLQDFNKEPEFKSSVIASVSGIIGGYVSRKLLFGKSNSVLKKVLGIGLQLATTKLIAQKVK
ncbi:hypothetical protein [uncultured Dokdonia sp.]|uniref:hypothetical protein n=1 Tax=uncultured Dokdonia sp. TaxID=575653 RepID=UPI00260CCF0D|nr:hypothetical protein [uncultured Dokdonia sp.]